MVQVIAVPVWLALAARARTLRLPSFLLTRTRSTILSLTSFITTLGSALLTKTHCTLEEVFHCQPDDEVTTWRHYIEYKALYDKFATIQGLQPRTEGLNVDMPENSGDQEVDDARQELEERASNGDSQVVADAEEEDHDVHSGTGNVEGESVPESPGSVGEEPQPAQQKRHYKAAKRRRVNQRSVRRNNIIRNDNVYDPETAEHVLQGVRGSLVFFPTDWLGHEIETGNWQHSIDHLPPLEIYD